MTAGSNRYHLQVPVLWELLGNQPAHEIGIDPRRQVPSVGTAV